MQEQASAKAGPTSPLPDHRRADVTTCCKTRTSGQPALLAAVCQTLSLLGMQSTMLALERSMQCARTPLSVCLPQIMTGSTPPPPLPNFKRAGQNHLKGGWEWCPAREGS